MRPENPIVPGAFTDDATRSKLTSAASRTGGASPPARTSSLELPPPRRSLRVQTLSSDVLVKQLDRLEFALAQVAVPTIFDRITHSLRADRRENCFVTFGTSFRGQKIGSMDCAEFSPRHGDSSRQFFVCSHVRHTCGR